MRQRRAARPAVAWGKSLDFDLIGRDDELALVQALLDAARSRVSGALVVEGEPGIGKSALLRSAERRADGFRCIRVGGIESEHVLPHAGLLQALNPLRDRLFDVPPAQRDALAAALGWGPVGASSSAQPFLVGAATLSLLAAEADFNPVLVLVDDVHWLDRESTAALAFAARRLQDDAVAFIVAGRAGAMPDELLDGLRVVVPRGLSRDEAATLLDGELSASVAAKLADDTRGNPLALIEAAARLSAAQRVGSAPLPEGLPVGDRLNGFYQQLLSGLSPHAWHAVLLCALNRSASTLPVAMALERDGADAAAALDEAVDFGVLVRDGTGLSFRHPLLRACAVTLATAAQQRRAHLALAEALSDEPGTLARAWHRAEASTGPDPELAEELVGLADESRSRRGYSAASTVLERASQLTGGGRRRAALLSAAARDAFLAGDVARTTALTSAVLDATDEPTIRGEALATVGRVELSAGSVPRAEELLTSAVDLLDGLELTRALAELALVRFRLNDMDGIADCGRRIVASADREDPGQRMLADFTRALAAGVGGDFHTSRRLMGDVVTQVARPPLRDDPQALVYLALAAGWLNDVPRVFALAEHLLTVTRERGAFGVLIPALALTATGRAWVGDHAGAFAEAGEAVELARQLGYAADVSNSADMLAWQSAARGLDEDARRAVALARELTDRAGTTAYAAHVATTEAFCALSRGDPQAAAQVLEGRLAIDGGVGPMGDPLGIAPELVEAYVALGRAAEAAQLAERFAAVTPPSAPTLQLALVARARGMSADDDAAAAAAFESALAHHALAPHPFETARTELLYGARLRRSGQRIKARVLLQRAHDSFAAMDLAAWARRAADELAATGARARKREITASEPLTSRETHVALHAARGLSNKEIAAALYLSPKTIERHLSSVYRKRGFRSRTELAAAFGRPEWLAVDERDSPG